ncbi:hypothetical protein GCM10007877_15980 [Marinibactrum halimedae]|uniref:PilZ domain-containing protein n=1 Tax=Marinibactrum halimedae TaxID=1444977 RepID=A0AA37T507_9GAMM|nr:hypothetical protein GCM10007877_15980 [Marinibactrum halimedae]
MRYRANALLISGESRWPVEVIDISYNGVLAATLQQLPLHTRDEVTLHLPTDSGETIRLQGSLAHRNGQYLGLQCKATNIDFRSRLRELIEQRQPLQ